MGENTKIQWCDHSWNPWIGCQRVSPGCKHCYAETQDARWRKPETRRWGPKAPRERTGAENWRKPLGWNKRAAKLGVRERVFCASLADVFEDRPELRPWRADLFKLIDATPHLDWLLLTKRPENAEGAMHQAALDAFPGRGPADVVVWPGNVWLGTTAEDGRRAGERVTTLALIPARVRFVSVEPQLEYFDMKPFLCPPMSAIGKIHWVIQGGESGPGARPFDPAWAQSLASQCKENGTAYFLKQLGAKPVGLKLKDSHGGDMTEWPADLQKLGRAFPEVER